MKHYLKPNENVVFLRNKKDILSFDVSAIVVDVNFDYTTNRGNKNNKTERILYFESTNFINFLLSRHSDKLNGYISKFFNNVYLKHYNDKYPYRALYNVNICEVTVIEVSLLQFDKDGLFIDTKNELEKRNILGYPTNVILCESKISYKQNNKLVTKVVYSFDTDTYRQDNAYPKSKEFIETGISSKLNKLKETVIYKGKKAIWIEDNKKISNVKILDILKISPLTFE